jgi:diguanylate cyclase (GGDEF)-like protein
MKKIVYVIDDNTLNLSMAEIALVNQYKVVALPSAEKMFKTLPKIKPDLILLDIEMPEMNGLEAIAKLKESPEWRDIPVVFTSGLDDNKMLPDVLELGAIDVIYKPFISSILLNCVNGYVNKCHIIKDKEKYSVLIIDDQTTGIALLTQILTPDYIVYTAENGYDGIKVAKEYLPDIILLDILMHEMDGYAVIAELRNNDVTKHIPIIFVSTLGEEVDEEKGLALGAADYIAKPFSAAIVKLRIHNQLKMIEQIRMSERLSMYDQLTDLPNRRSFEIRLSAEWGRALREQTPISILLIDIDHFKYYNDTYGHLLGDVALQYIAKTFNKTLKRPVDFVARWGGEEFIALLPNTDLKGSLEVAELIRKTVEQVDIPVSDNRTARITVSIGAVSQEDELCKTTDELISKADKAMYIAKKQGRNRVCCYSKT